MGIKAESDIISKKQREKVVMLKKIECIVQPFKLKEIKEGFREIAIDGMTITEVSGCGKQKGHTENVESNEAINFLPKVKIEIVTEEERVEDIIDVIQMLAKTGQIGAGKIFVLPVEDVIRVRTKESGRSAIE